MSDAAKETMQLEQSQQTEQPQGTPPTETPKGGDDIQAFMAELDKIGVKNPDQLRGMANASYQAGVLANMVGELRKEIATLKGQQGQRPAVGQTDDYGQSTDLQAIIRNTIRDFYQNEVIGPQQQAREVFQRDLVAIQQDDDFPIVKDLFEKYTQDPNVAFDIQSGNKSLKTVYDQVVRSYYRGIAQRSRDVIKGLADKGVIVPPHTETGQTGNLIPKDTNPNARDALNQIHDKHAKAGKAGSEAMLDDMVSALFPKGHPFTLGG